MSIVTTTPGKTLAEGSSERKLENERLILMLLALRAVPLRIESIGRLIFFIFDAKETEKYEAQILSNQSIMVDIRDFCAGLDLWKNAITLSKSKNTDPA